MLHPDGAHLVFRMLQCPRAQPGSVLRDVRALGEVGGAASLVMGTTALGRGQQAGQPTASSFPRDGGVGREKGREAGLWPSFHLGPPWEKAPENEGKALGPKLPAHLRKRVNEAEKVLTQHRPCFLPAARSRNCRTWGAGAGKAPGGRGGREGPLRGAQGPGHGGEERTELWEEFQVLASSAAIATDSWRVAA